MENGVPCCPQTPGMVEKGLMDAFEATCAETRIRCGVDHAKLGDLEPGSGKKTFANIVPANGGL